MKTMKETWVLFIHYEKILIRNPYWVLAALFQPVCYLYLFAPLLNHVMGSGTTSAINMFTPGLLVMVSLFSVMFVGYGMIDYLRSGVIERLRVTTSSRLALLLGLVIRDVLTLIMQTLLVILLALPLGLTISPLGIVLTLFMMILIGLCISPASYALALTVKTEDALGPILNFFSQPLLLLSGVLLPLTLAPAWLKNISALNPLKYAVDASRAIFNGDIANASVWHAFVLLGVIVALSFWWGLSCMKKATE
jgi:ABC-type multidrug transport system, permease component